MAHDPAEEHPQIIFPRNASKPPIPLPFELSITYVINSRSRLQKLRREPDAHCDAPKPNPDDRASMTIWVQILAEVRPELEWFMALQNEPPLMA
jgi:hypothetical protein